MKDKKILVKGGPKQYKTHAGVSGPLKLYHQLFHLYRRAAKAAQQPGASAFVIAMSDELKSVIEVLSEYDKTA
jgi:hypothetical protein